MIKLVIVCNIAIALFGFFLAWRIWQVKRTLTKATVLLTAWERHTHQALNPARTPDLILKGQRGTASLRQQYARLEQQLHQLERIFAMALMTLRFLPLARKQAPTPWWRQFWR